MYVGFGVLGLLKDKVEPPGLWIPVFGFKLRFLGFGIVGLGLRF